MLPRFSLLKERAVSTPKVRLPFSKCWFVLNQLKARAQQGYGFIILLLLPKIKAKGQKVGDAACLAEAGT